jgi:phospholipid/cholesterol/gamma-HCH transport system substrate-binding protein
MDERVVQFRVGVTVLAALIITGILSLLFGELPGVLRGTYQVYIEFPAAPGVSQDTPVKKSGIRIGKVSKVQFAPDNQVLVTATIDRGIELYRDEAVRIKSGLLGDTELEFVPGAKRTVAQKIPLAPGDLLAGTVQGDPINSLGNIEGNLNTAAISLGNAAEEVGKLAKGVNDVLGANREQISKVIGEMDGTLQLFQKSLTNIDDIIGDQQTKAQLKQTVSEMPQLMRETREAVLGIQKTVALADDNLRNIQTVTKALDERGEGMINDAAQSVQRLDELLGQMNRFSRNLNSKEGSLGQLVNNPELYNNLSQAALNVNKLTRELEPILCNAKVFTDKIARHPGEILRDAASPGPGLK